jgi:hypothetical protein
LRGDKEGCKILFSGQNYTPLRPHQGGIINLVFLSGADRGNNTFKIEIIFSELKSIRFFRIRQVFFNKLIINGISIINQGGTFFDSLTSAHSLVV